MADTGTYGHPELLIVDDGTKVWTTPVVALGSTLLVSLVIGGGSHLAMDPAARPTVFLATGDPDGGWRNCQAVAGGGGGADACMVRYAMFEHPVSDLPSEVRLEVQYRGKTVIRVMALEDAGHGKPD